MVLKEMHWSWNDLMEIPEREYQAYIRIMGIEGKERKNASERSRSGNKMGSGRRGK